MATWKEDGALVCVWRDAGSALAMARTHTFGHASLKLVGPSYQGGGREGVYVSWWPKDSQGAGIFTEALEASLGDSYKDDEAAAVGDNARAALERGSPPRRGQKLLNPDEPDPDARVWGRQPDAKVFVPGATEERPWGLDLDAIQIWWRAYTHAGAGTFHMTRRNCSVVVGKALRAGGAHDLASKPIHVYFRPTLLEAWARDLAAACARLNADATRLRAFTPRGPVEPRDSLPTSAEWNARSRALRGKHPVLASVGALLDAYADEPGDTKEDRGAKMARIGEILRVLHEPLHQAGASKSVPLPVLLDLGTQCLESLGHWAKVGKAKRRRAVLASRTFPQAGDGTSGRD